jgi:hypothetical protein
MQRKSQKHLLESLRIISSFSLRMIILVTDQRPRQFPLRSISGAHHPPTAQMHRGAVKQSYYWSL